jgi:glycosyltransferase involved in cell wall biosynthesis
MKLIKSFYLQNPQFKWITFRDMRGLSRKDFAKTLGESCASVWVDRISSFGTFPIESMMCNTPCIGTLPIMKPSWLTEGNGIWVFDESKVVEIIAGFLKNWLEDSVPPALYEKMVETSSKFSNDKERKEVISYFDSLLDEKSAELESSINKLTPVSEPS